MARGGTVLGERPSHGGSLQPSWPALGGLTIAAIAGFIGVGFLIGVPTARLSTYIALVVAWWLIAALALGLTVPTVSTWRPAGMAVAQGAILIVTWGAALALSLPLALEPWWLQVGLRLPVCIILVVGFGQILRARELAALARADRERELLAIQSETHALLDAHAAIVEEARSASFDVTAAVRAALRMSHSQGLQDARVRVVLDGDVRRRASAAGRRIHAMRSEPTQQQLPRLRRLGPWLDDLAFAPRWHILLAYALLASTMVIADLGSPAWRSGLAFIAAGVAGGCLISLACAHVARPRLSRWPTSLRRAAFPGSLVLGLAVALPISALGLPGIDSAEIGLAALSRLPAALAIVALPGAFSASVRRSQIGMSGIEGEIVLARTRRDMALVDLEEARRSIVSTLHTHVQGRAAAAIAALELADAGVPGTREIVDAVLEELSDLDITRTLGQSSSPMPVALSSDPVHSVVQSWSRVMCVSLTDTADAPPALRYRLATHVEDALVNAAVHGRARTVDITIEAEGPLLLLRVQDDGVGAPPIVEAGLGLQQMGDRGATWQLTGTPAGSLLIVTIPMGPQPLRTAPHSRNEQV